jgi:glycosyl transferase family 25
MINEVFKLNNTFDVHFFNAIDCQENEHIPFKTKYFSKLTKYFRAKDLTAGELACYASHYCMWLECIKLNEPIIVLEDDIIIENHFAEGIKNIISSNYSFVKLSSINIYSKDRAKTNHYINKNFILSHKRVDGAQGYYITPFAANAFIKHSRKWYKPVDDYMESFWIHNIPIITYHPRLIEDHPNWKTTTIEHRKIKVPFRYKITRELSQLFRDIRRQINIHSKNYDI